MTVMLKILKQKLFIGDGLMKLKLINNTTVQSRLD